MNVHDKCDFVNNGCIVLNVISNLIGQVAPCGLSRSRITSFKKDLYVKILIKILIVFLVAKNIFIFYCLFSITEEK